MSPQAKMEQYILHGVAAIPHSELRTPNFLVLSPLQETTFLFGQPVAGNPTQFMMERAFAAAGLDWRYLTLEIPPERLGDAVRGVRAMGFRGGNVTMPHKVAVIEYLDELTEGAGLMQAVNCIHNRDGRLIGENTDGKGFLQSLRTLTEPAGKKVVVLGAGGAARAIAVELALAGAAEITIVNRNAQRGRQLADLIRDKTSTSSGYVEWTEDFAIPADAEVLINATSIGLFDRSARVPIKLDTLRHGLVVADVIFNPADTRLLREARDRGCATLDGLGMLVNQAVIAFRLWTSLDPDAALVRESLEEFLSV
jgi:shikimate dehydrogenase